MKHLYVLLLLFPILLFSNEIIPSSISEVTVYQNGAQIKRTASCFLAAGKSVITFNRLSPKIDESSIQLSGLQNASILSIAYNINYISGATTAASDDLEVELKNISLALATLQNEIEGLQQEQSIITTNRIVSSEKIALDLNKIKEISTYYRERTTAIKNSIHKIELKIGDLTKQKIAIEKQQKELYNTPDTKQGEITITLDNAYASTLQLEIRYQVEDAGWIPTYDLYAKHINAPLELSYKAYVYQKTGVNWENVNINLATGNPTIQTTKPFVGTKHLDFISGYSKPKHFKRSSGKYIYNPLVKVVHGTVTDNAGEPLPGVNITINGSSRGTQTDFDGNYSISTENGQMLSYSYIGFTTQEIPIYSSIMNISMEEDAEHLDEVVVLGYGVSNALAGRVSGVQITNGRAPTPSYPLFVIDGVPTPNYTEGDLDENEIAHINILDNKESDGLYGARANQKVILITTKKKTNTSENNQIFKISKQHSITSNGDITSIKIDEFSFKGKYEYFSAPVINENVYLTASFTDWETYNLLPGEVSVYYDGTYAGKTSIDPYSTKKEISLSLGIEPNIVVQRRQVKNFKDKSFSGNTRILDRTYAIEVKNNTQKSIDLVLVDRIPISQNKDIKIDKVETNNAKYEEEKGILKWMLPLKSKSSTEEQFSFRVKYPKHRSINL